MGLPLSVAPSRVDTGPSRHYHRLAVTEATKRADDPIARFAELFTAAARTEPFDATRAALATATRDGRPSVRFVLVKIADARGFAFFTNYESRKGRELDDNPWAALAWHWSSTGVQVRAEGPVHRLAPEESDAYFRTRPLPSRIGAWASPQSRPIAGDWELLARVARATLRHGVDPPRPPFWGGYRLVPERIELWFEGQARLHCRELYERDGSSWRRTRLAP